MIFFIEYGGWLNSNDYMRDYNFKESRIEFC